MKGNHMWTKEEIRTIRDLWDSKTIDEMQQALGVNKAQLLYVVKTMRKAGFNLTKKHSSWGETNGLIKEVLAETY